MTILYERKNKKVAQLEKRNIVAMFRNKQIQFVQITIWPLEVSGWTKTMQKDAHNACQFAFLVFGRRFFSLVGNNGSLC